MQRRARRGVAVGRFSLAGVALGVVLAACGSNPTALETTGMSREPIVGGTPDPHVATAGTVVNRYAPLEADAPQGSTTLMVTHAAAALQAAPGDLLLVVQMQGATMDDTNTPTYGAVRSLGGAGLYEMVTVGSVAGDEVTLAAGCGLLNSYSAAGATQVVWVPQYATLTVLAGGTITCPPWNGQVGGVIALQANTIDLEGSIDASKLGFRGGQLIDQTAEPPTVTFQYCSTDPDTGGEKGESVVGFETGYDPIGGRYSLGAPANGGGGGAAHNGGGGGGANGGAVAGWNGAGVMPSGGTPAGPWSEAWALDESAIAAGGPTTSSGGGRGGYSFSLNARNPLTTAPGDITWGGDLRNYRGGLGGRPLSGDPTTRLFAGGGGGAGSENNGNGGPGGNGGGIVVVLANSIVGNGKLTADGDVGGPTTGVGRDGAGGGGAGGSIAVFAASMNPGIATSAQGGLGGVQTINAFLYGNEAEGPGGGGGGGFVALPSGATGPLLAGGAGGTTNSPAMFAFTPNGATNGGPGALVTLASAASPSICIASDFGVAMTDGVQTVSPGSDVTYTITVTNNGPNPATGATLSDPFSTGGMFASDTWTCSGAGCPATSGSGDIDATIGSLSAGQSATFTVSAVVSPSATGTLSNTATVSPPHGIVDGNPGNNSVTLENPIAGGSLGGADAGGDGGPAGAGDAGNEAEGGESDAAAGEDSANGSETGAPVDGAAAGGDGGSVVDMADAAAADGGEGSEGGDGGADASDASAASEGATDSGGDGGDASMEVVTDAGLEGRGDDAMAGPDLGILQGGGLSCTAAVGSARSDRGLQVGLVAALVGLGARSRRRGRSRR